MHIIESRNSKCFVNFAKKLVIPSSTFFFHDMHSAACADFILISSISFLLAVSVSCVGSEVDFDISPESISPE